MVRLWDTSLLSQDSLDAMLCPLAGRPLTRSEHDEYLAGHNEIQPCAEH
ncbi:hypothetical protein NRB56_63330 [Nocardia sp. RB56]|uniref:Uncharacterized protein n=1 Tax=Nocardia aurantia TaxID=2585199 RepID=A0A7K0DY53_9NOCA|nr:hypothetical protein [Nocardia aurantia]